MQTNNPSFVSSTIGSSKHTRSVTSRKSVESITEENQSINISH